MEVQGAEAHSWEPCIGSLHLGWVGDSRETLNGTLSRWSSGSPGQISQMS